MVAVPYHLERCRYDIEPYVEAVLEAKRRGYPVKLGLEVDYEPAQEEETRELLAPYPWDYLIGSIHFLDGPRDRRRAEPRRGVGVEEAWSRYYERSVAAARAASSTRSRIPTS